jgi:putative zinc finger/helix-turn-helix YgiT family protein
MKTKWCPTCGAERIEQGKTEHAVTVGAQKFVGKLPAEVCGACGESLVMSRALGAFERAVACHLAEHGPATGETFRYMRKAFGMPAKEVAEWLGTVPETISRWETGARDVDLWAWLTLGAIVLDAASGNQRTRERLQQLKARKLAKTVPIRVEAAPRRAKAR